MTFILRNLQKVIKVNTYMLEKHVLLLRKLMNVSWYDLSVTCLDDDAVRNLNNTYRDTDEPTDVLAFPFLETVEPGQLPVVNDDEERILGDIILGVPYIYNSCLQNSEHLEEILPVMVTHGMCHLIGYDHEEKNQWQQMYQKELGILQKFNAQTGYNCRPLLGVGH